MNLHGIAGPIIAAVNPTLVGTVKVSTGYTTAANGARTPTYRAVDGVPMQVQAMSAGDLRQTDALNLNGTKRGIYLYGRVDGIVRTENKGGDLVIPRTTYFTGSIADDVLTVTAVAMGALSVGDMVFGTGVAADTRIAALLTGTGGAGTYSISPGGQTVASGALSSGAVWLTSMVLEQWPDWCKVACVLQNGT